MERVSGHVYSPQPIFLYLSSPDSWNEYNADDLISINATMNYPKKPGSICTNRGILPI